MKVLTFSRQFPKGHPKAGQPTHFPEKIMAGLADKAQNFKIPDDFVLWEWLPYYNCTQPKWHTIRSGNNWKSGDQFSARVWSGAPYRSKQIEFAQVEVKNTQTFEIKQKNKYLIWSIDGQDRELFAVGSNALEVIARNGGLTIEDFISWFSIHPKKTGEGFYGQVICWSDQIEY